MGEFGIGSASAGARRGRLTAALVGLTAMCALSAGCVAPFAVHAGRAWGASEEGGSMISIRQDDDDAPPPGCAPAGDALRYSTVDTAESFTLRVTVAASLCAPITAVAAVYRMPGNGVAWPQDLLERQEFELAAAGSTEIVFTKTCVPVQFDVVTGATPERIAPWADRHGPLLFPGDTRTASQHWGGSCNGGSTTTTPPSVSPTTVPSGGVPTTMPEGPGVTTPPSVSGTPTEVLGATTVPTELAAVAAPDTADTPVTVASSGADEPPRVAGLALTGTSILVLVVSGLVLVLAGVAAQVAPGRSARRRRA